MKTPEEIKKGLELIGCTSIVEFIKAAQYGPDYDCDEAIAKDALAYIEQLESRLAQVERERDAAVADLKDCADGHCIHCKNINLAAECDFGGECYTCLNEECPCHERNCRWQWRGVCEGGNT